MTNSINSTKAGIPQASAPVFASDYKYADESDIKAVTEDQLAKLEVELHTMRMMFVANGENPDVMISAGRKIGEEMQKVETVIANLEAYFAAILTSDDAPV